jgi:hypothetical protein
LSRHCLRIQQVLMSAAVAMMLPVTMGAITWGWRWGGSAAGGVGSTIC